MKPRVCEELEQVAGTGAEYVQRTDGQIAARLVEIASMTTYRHISMVTGFHSESVRRYMGGRVKIPATFIAAFSKAFSVDVHDLLFAVGEEGGTEPHEGRQGVELSGSAEQSDIPDARELAFSVQTRSGVIGENSGDRR